MLESIAYSIISGITVSAEIVVYEYITSNDKNLNSELLVWIYRIGSILFISLFLIYMIHKNPMFKDTTLKTLRNNTYIGWYILLSLLSAIGIISFFRSIDKAGSTSAGVPVSIRSLYIPLTFILSVIIVRNGNWGRYSKHTYIGLTGLSLSLCLILYGSIKDA
jgi:hypothetical protein